MSAPVLRRASVVVLALVASLLPAMAQPAAAEPLFASATTSYTSNPDPLAGQRFKIVGQVFLLFGDTPAPLPNQVVTLERRTTSTDPWTTVGQTTTMETTLPNGEKHVMYVFNRVADRTASYRVRYSGNADSDAIAGSLSDDGTADPVRVRVHRRMPIRLAQPKPSRIDLVGSVAPRYGHQRVVVLRKTCKACRWVRFAAPLTDARGRYRVRLSSPRTGSHLFVARAAASKGFALSYSQRARIRAAR
ncbi:hypothetical protein GCM10009815_24100 [Nocardioides marmoribigeumensis]